MGLIVLLIMQMRKPAPQQDAQAALLIKQDLTKLSDDINRFKEGFQVQMSQRMDRNQDGDLTWKEFLGPRHVFEALDANKDGLIDPEEAEKAEMFK